MILAGHLTVFSNMLAEIPHQTFGELSAPYQVLRWLIHAKKYLKQRNKPRFQIISML